MTVFAPLLLLAPVMLLAAAVVGLVRHGPLGWLGAAVLLAGVALASRWLWRRGRAWWATTKAPEHFEPRTRLRHPPSH